MDQGRALRERDPAPLCLSHPGALERRRDLLAAGIRTFRHYGPVWQLTRPLRAALALPFEAALGPLGAARDAPYESHRFDLKFGRKRERNLYFIYRHPLARTRPYFERTLDNIRALAAEVTSSGARFALVVAPRFHHWNPEECPDNWESDLYALDEPHQYEYFRFFREARGHVGFPIHDLLPVFRETDEFPLVFRWDPHWNERGHALVADSLSRYVLASGLLEASRTNPSRDRPGRPDTCSTRKDWRWTRSSESEGLRMGIVAMQGS